MLYVSKKNKEVEKKKREIKDELQSLLKEKFGPDIKMAKTDFKQVPCYAIENNFGTVIQKLVENDFCDIDKDDNMLLTYLHAAIDFRHYKVLSILLTSSKIKNHINKLSLKNSKTVEGTYFELQGDAPIHHAVKNNDIEALGILLDSGANVNLRSDDGTTPFFMALFQGSDELADYLVSRGAKIQADDNEDILSVEILNGSTHYYIYNNPLHQAISTKNYLAFEYLMEKNVDVNRTVKGILITPLHLAVESGEPKMVEKLLNKGANVDAPTIDGQTPLHLALDMANNAMILAILQNNPDVNIKNNFGKTPLEIAISKNVHKSIIKHLFTKTDISKSETILPLVIKYVLSLEERGEKIIPIIEKNLEDGLYKDNFDGKFASALSEVLKEVISTKKVHLIKDVIKIIDSKDFFKKYNNVTKSVIAEELPKSIRWIDVDLFKYLESFFNPIDSQFLLKHSILNHNSRIAEYIIDKEQEKILEFVYEEGRSVLHLAARSGMGPLVKKVLKLGGDPNLQDSTGKTPLDFAITFKYWAIVKTLCDAMGIPEITPEKYFSKPEISEISEIELAVAVSDIKPEKRKKKSNKVKPQLQDSKIEPSKNDASIKKVSSWIDPDGTVYSSAAQNVWKITGVGGEERYFALPASFFLENERTEVKKAFAEKLPLKSSYARKEADQGVKWEFGGVYAGKLKGEFGWARLLAYKNLYNPDGEILTVFDEEILPHEGYESRLGNIKSININVDSIASCADSNNEINSIKEWFESQSSDSPFVSSLQYWTEYSGGHYEEQKQAIGGGGLYE